MTTVAKRAFAHVSEALFNLRDGDVATFSYGTHAGDTFTFRVDTLSGNRLRFHVAHVDMWCRNVIPDGALFITRRNSMDWLIEMMIATEIRGHMVPHVNVYTPRVLKRAG